MKTEKQKIALFGGSFDPPHFGHIDIVRNLVKRFDKTIVIPSYISPFKGEENNAAYRVALCKKVFTPLGAEVSRFEISKKGVSYTVDTAAYIAKKTDGELYFVIGSEELIRLGDWREIDRLKTLVKFYVVRRPGFEPDKSLLAALKKRKIKIKFAPFEGLDISSSVIKINNAFGMPNMFVPDEVRSFAEKRNLFNPYGTYVDALYRYGMTYHRIMHVYRTALRGAELAKKFGVKTSDAITACILHDIAKPLNAEDYSDRVDLSGFPEPTMHGPVGAYIAKTEFGVSDEIAKAITYHSTACAELGTLGEVVYLADKTEDGRKYASLEHKRYLCDVDKNIAMLAALKEIRGLEKSAVCTFSDDAIAYYELICGDREIPELPERAVKIIADNSQEKPVKTAKYKSAAQTTIGKELWRARFVSSGNEIKDIAVAAADELSSHKAHDIDIIDIDGKTIIADYFVIASVSSTTAVKAMMGYVEDRLKKQFNLDPNRRDINSEWIALDFGGVIIHIFTDKTREFYNIERLWSDGHNVNRYEN